MQEHSSPQLEPQQPSAFDQEPGTRTAQAPGSAGKPSTLSPPAFGLTAQNEGQQQEERAEESEQIADAPGDGKIHAEDPASGEGGGDAGDLGGGAGAGAAAAGSGMPTDGGDGAGMGKGKGKSMLGTSKSKGKAAGKKKSSGGKGSGSDFSTYMKEAAKPAVDKAVDSVSNFSKAQKEKPDSATHVKQATKAVVPPAKEGVSKASASKVGTISQQTPKESDEAKTKNKFKADVEKHLPKKLKDAMDFKKGGKARKMMDVAKKQIKVDAGEVNNTYNKLRTTPPPAGVDTPVPMPGIADATAGKVKAVGQEMIAEIRPQDTDMGGYIDEAQAKMEEQGISDEHLNLVTSGDLHEAKLAKEDMNTTATTAISDVEAVRQGEINNLDQNLKQEASSGESEMKQARKKGLEDARKKQSEVKQTMEDKRKEVADNVMNMYQQVRTQVDTKLSQLNDAAMSEFDTGQKKASEEFSSKVDKRMKAYKKKRYKGIRGKFRWVKDKILGMNKLPEVKRILDEEKQKFINKCDQLIQKITKKNNTVIQECRDLVTGVRDKIKTYVDGLDPELKGAGDDAMSEIESELDELDEEINRKQEELIAQLQMKKDEAIAEIDKKIEELKSKMGGLIAKIGKFLLDAALKFIRWALEAVGIDPEPVLNVIKKVAGVIVAIVKNPIGFLKNLFAAVKGAFKGFFENIKDNILEAVMGWITGKMEGTGIEIPKNFSLRSILKFVMQVLGVSWEELKERLFGSLGGGGGILDGIVNVVSAFFKGGPDAMWEALKTELMTKGMPELTEKVGDAVGSENMDTVETIGGLATGATDAIKDGALPKHVANTVKDKGWDWLRAKLVDRFGESVVSTLERVGKLVKGLVTEGPAALWEFLKESAADLKQMFFDTLKKWAATELVKKGITKLMTFLIPGGGIIEAVIGIFKSIMFFIENAGLLGKIVGSLFGAVGDIGAGNISGAIGKIITAIKLSLVALIKFFAKLLNLDKIVDVVRNVIEKVRKFIDKPIQKVIDFISNGLKKFFGKIKEWFKSLLGKGGEGEGEENGTGQSNEEIKLDPTTGWPIYVGNEEKTKLVHAGIKDLIESTQPYLQDEKLPMADAQKVAADVKGRHNVFTSLKASTGPEVPSSLSDRKEGDEKNYYLFTASPMQIIPGGDSENSNENGDPELTDEEIRTMLSSFGEKGPQPVTGGTGKVSPQVALQILDNISKGEHPFKPELGKGGASWFVTEGSPYVGISPDKSIGVQVEISNMSEAMTFGEAELCQIFEETKTEVTAEAEAKYRNYNKIAADKALNSKQRKGFARFLDKFAESRMWDKVGEKVACSSSQVGEVVLENSQFSKQGNGKFAVVADPAKIQVKEGIPMMVEALKSQGHGAEPTVAEAAAEWSRQKNVGRVQGVFRVAGKILIVVGIAADAYKIYRAEDKLKATMTSAGGWVGAASASAAFATWFAPADVAGPVAWFCHGVGTLIAGGVGYFVGSEATGYIYELVVEE